MNKVINIVLLFSMTFTLPSKAYTFDSGFISGQLTLDESWEKKIYASYIQAFEKEYSVSNTSIVASSIIDSMGNFNLDLNNIPNTWSLIRLHLVKKGITPNSLVIGSKEENFMFLVVKRGSKIILRNSGDMPIFENTKIEQANYMATFIDIRKLIHYVNSIDYKSSLIEKEFIQEVIEEKLKSIADTCSNPVVSLYAIYQTDFISDYNIDPIYYENYLSKWEEEKSIYFDSFRSKFPKKNSKESSSYYWSIILILISLSGITSFIFVYIKKKNRSIEKLSIQERKIFGLLRKGMTNKEISAECNIELSTVKSHVGSIYSKLKIKSRKEAINFKTKLL